MTPRFNGADFEFLEGETVVEHTHGERPLRPRRDDEWVVFERRGQRGAPELFAVDIETHRLAEYLANARERYLESRERLGRFSVHTAQAWELTRLEARRSGSELG